MTYMRPATVPSHARDAPRSASSDGTRMPNERRTLAVYASVSEVTATIRARASRFIRWTTVAFGIRCRRARRLEPAGGDRELDLVPWPREIVESLVARVVAGQARDVPAGPGADAAEVEPADRRPVVRHPRHRAHREHPLRRHVAVRDMALHQAELALEVDRAEEAVVDDDVLDVRDVVAQHVDAVVPEAIALRSPVAAVRE